MHRVLEQKNEWIDYDRKNVFAIMFNMHSTFQLSISFVMERRILISPNKAVISSYNCAIVVF